MGGEERIYLAVDLKSFYASVECRERGLDPMTTNLVVADESRTEKTICLAVSPSLKAYGISGRARLFEVIQRVKEVNGRRRAAAPGHELTGSSWDDKELKASPELAVSYIIAPPRMAYYIRYSTRIYQIYLKYVAPEDMHVYSIDEVFLDVTQYLGIYGMTPRELAGRICLDVLESTGITAAAGIGTNLYLCKAAMDIVAKHIEPDQNGVRIAYLNEREYRRLLWSHRPLTDFWRVGRGYEKKLEEHGLFTMGDIARCSLGGLGDYHNEELLYRLFGVNAELLIDHAWGWEPCTIADIRAYRPENNSLVSGQVLPCGYDFDKARLVLREMADQMALDLVEKNLETDQLTLTVSYDREALSGSGRENSYKGEITRDRYGRDVPKPAHGTIHLKRATSSSRLLTEAAAGLYDRIMDRRLTVRKLSLTADRVAEPGHGQEAESFQQMDLFTDYAALERERRQEEQQLEREKRLQKTMLDIRKRFGKNAILKGMNFEEGATARERNKQIGGHKA